MWTRKELKNNAKNQMKEKYFNYLGISLLPQLASYISQNFVSAIGMFLNLMFMNTLLLNDQFVRWMVSVEKTGDVFDIEPSLIALLSGTLLIPYSFIIISSILISWFLVYPVIVGMYKWFLRAREQWPVPFGLCLNIYKKGNYLSTVGSIAYRDLFLFLWSLLFIIPVFIKQYSYRMVPLILADNPQIGAKKALQISKLMTKGNKLKMFILDLSFLGWYLLGVAAFCIGFLAVIPYHHATVCELYDILKKEAVAKGICTMEELGYQYEL